MRIAVYARVSTQRQVHDQTIEQQLDRLQAHIRAQGGSLPDENVFRDDGYSGAHLGRPGLDRLRDRAAQRELDKVLITDPDRLARNYVHQMLLIEEFERFGCEIEFLDRPMSHDPHDQLLLQIRGAVAEYERSLIAERMRRGRQAKLRAGSLLPWTRAPYGLRLNPDRPRDPTGVSVDAAESAIVAEMFAYYLEDGQTLFGLTKHLMAIQVPTPTGQMRWNVATIRGILTNPAYTGQVYAGRTRSRPAQVRRSATHPIGQPTGSRVFTPSDEWIPVATIPAIITQEQFDRVQAKLAHNQQCASRNNKAHDYLLRALVSCGVCQLSCTGRTLSPGYDYYLCSGKAGPIHACRDGRCSARYIPAHQLDDLVWQDLCQVLTHPEIIVQALQRAQGGQWLPQELQARRENLRKAQVNLNHQVDRLTEAYLGSVIPLAEYQRRRRELEQKSQALESQEKQLEARVDRQMELTGLVTSMEDFCQRVQAGLADATFEQKRQLVELLIDRVVVTNEEVEIRYVIPTSSSSEHIRFCHLRKDYLDLPSQPIQVDDQCQRILLPRHEAGDIQMPALVFGNPLPHQTDSVAHLGVGAAHVDQAIDLTPLQHNVFQALPPPISGHRHRPPGGADCNRPAVG
jgi:site-specific DNA recombinase